jgi:hypothetical protein
MEAGEEFRFCIDAYTPETMPLDRLAEYLAELAQVLGDARSVHLVELEPGSTVLIHKVDAQAVPKIRDQVAAVRHGNAPRPAMAAYQKINRLLREDNGSGVLIEESGAEILDFPGKREEIPYFAAIEEYGEIDGEVIRVGGTGDPVPILLSADAGAFSGCWAKRSIAKPLANHLFEPVRLFGQGRWIRDAEGQWLLSRLNVDRFQVLEQEVLSAALTKLRAIPGLEWGDEALDELLRLRHGDGNEAEDGGV